ncbi:MAG: cyclic nucleotide-binding domain-containing protein [Bdellovibrionales bacterium]|nr:cyclic nucleotide-binding domain-containing protein [Bdellovibrionales bacterium]
MSFESLTVKRRFLVASVDAEVRNQLEKFIASKISNVQVFSASDGSDALSKMQNLPPHVLICEQDLPKISGLKLAEEVINDPTLKEIAVIILGEVPETEVFVDHIVTGQVQFVDPAASATLMGKALIRAMNFVASTYVKEFNLRFLAPGEILIKAGDLAESVFIVRRGRLSAWKSGETSNTGSKPLGYIEKGEFVGEMAYISGEARSADVLCEDECELIEIPVDLLDNILFQKPSWSKALMVTLSRRIKKANAR